MANRFLATAESTCIFQGKYYVNRSRDIHIHMWKRNNKFSRKAPSCLIIPRIVVLQNTARAYPHAYVLVHHVIYMLTILFTFILRDWCWDSLATDEQKAKRGLGLQLFEK